MSFFKKGTAALGRLVAVGVLLAVFLAGMMSVMYFSLQGSEIKVPEITGKSFGESENELASLGLKIKKRADRVTNDPPNTIIEQLPKPGETVKTGQMILVVTSRPPASGETAPTVIKGSEDDTEKIEEMITDKPKKPKTNTNTNRKKADTTRDVNAAPSDTDTKSSSNSSADASNSNKAAHEPADKSKKETQPPVKPPAAKPSDEKPKSQSRPHR